MAADDHDAHVHSCPIGDGIFGVAICGESDGPPLRCPSPHAHRKKIKCVATSAWTSFWAAHHRQQALLDVRIHCTS